MNESMALWPMTASDRSITYRVSSRGCAECDQCGSVRVLEWRLIPCQHLVHGWAHSRRYVIKDLGIDPEWTAELTIFAKEIAVLASFDVEFVAMQDMRRAKAWNWDDNLVYQYSEKSPGESFNAIYDDMPMHGWWPWPLRYEQSVVGDGWEMSMCATIVP